MPMAEEQSGAVADPGLLSGERILLAKDNFDPDVVTLLTSYAADLGAQISEDRQQATVVLLNPASLEYKPELERIASFRRSHPKIQQTVVSYHWLSGCHYRAERLDPSTLTPARPIFTNPDRSKGYQPLRAWVSLNVRRHADEDAHTAHTVVCEVLAKGGALLVKKRAQADVLIVDTESNFYKTVRDERDRYGRTHQRLAEREWVEDCYANKIVAWRSEREEAADNAQDEESFGEEEVHRGTGPGRPTGIPRKEYTPSEDDFLCRYLAAHNPDGSWRSRKTYGVLVALADTYPTAASHSTQSWHERFKKNAAVFSRRVEVLVAAGIDKSLKTAPERAKEAERKKAAKAAAAKSRVEHDTPSSSTNAAGPSREAPASPARTPKKRASAAGPSKKVLVELDAESDPRRTGKTADAATTSAAAQTSAETPVPIAPVPKGRSSSPASSAAVRAQATQPRPEDQFDSLLPPIAAAASSRGALQGDSAIVDASLRDDAVQGSQLAQDSPAVAVEERESQLSNGSGHREPSGAETQAILSDFERARATVRAAQQSNQTSSSTTEAAAATREIGDADGQAARLHARGSSMPRSPRPTPLPTHAPHTEPVQQAESTRSAGRPEAPAPPRSAIRGPRISESADGRQIVSFPVTVNFRPILPATDTSTEDDTDTDGQHRRQYRLSSGAAYTPSPSRKSLLREELMNSSAASGQRRSRLSYNPSIGYSDGGGDSGGKRRKRHASPDMVYASPAIPAPIIRPPPPEGSVIPSIRRRPSPPLEEHERREKVYSGQAVVVAKAALYRSNIARLCLKYGTTPIELQKELDNVREEGEVGLPWDELENRLDEYLYPVS